MSRTFSPLVITAMTASSMSLTGSCRSSAFFSPLGQRVANDTIAARHNRRQEIRNVLFLCLLLMEMLVLIFAELGCITYQGDTGNFFRQRRRCWFAFNIVVHEGEAVSDNFLVGRYAGIGPSEVSSLVEFNKVLRLRRPIISTRAFLQHGSSTKIQRAALKHHRR